MRDCKPQHCVQQLKRLKMTRNATNSDKHINEASKQNLANTLIKISCKYTQGTFSNGKICFNVLSKQYYNDDLYSLSKINESDHKNYLWGTNKRGIERQRWPNPAPTHRSCVALEWFCFLPRNVDGQHLVLMRANEYKQGFQATSCAQAQGQAT